MTHRRKTRLRTGKRQGDQFSVEVTSVLVPAGRERLARAFDLVLRAAARAEEHREAGGSSPGRRHGDYIGLHGKGLPKGKEESNW